jgi:dihydroorotase
MTWRSKQGTDLLRSHDWHVQRNQTILFIGARLIDPSQGLDEVADILVERGKISAVGEIDRTKLKEHVEVNLRGKILAPGFQDMHAHFGQPGREDRETLTSGICAAAAGGYTGVSIRPDTEPYIDNAGIVKWIEDKTNGSPVLVQPVAAVARDDEGRRLSDIDDIYHAGVRVFSDTGRPAATPEIMRRALDYMKLHDLTITTRTQEPSLASDGIVREGPVSTRLGQKPWPSIAESMGVAKTLLLAMYTNGKVHLEAVSSAETLDLIRWARERGVQVTCDTTPHHLALTDEACESFDGNYKTSPPLGTDKDREALFTAIMDGTIDAIAADHVPLTGEECLVEYTMVPDGVVGLETTLGVLAKVTGSGKPEWNKLINLLSIRPREILGLPLSTIQKGSAADLTIIDPEAVWSVDPKRFFSKGRNTPFGGWKLPVKSLGIINRGWFLLAPDARMLLK